MTGLANVQNQERLQLEALNGPIALGVADVIMKEFPRAGQQCVGNIADLLIKDDYQTENPQSLATAAVSGLY